MKWAQQIPNVVDLCNGAISTLPIIQPLECIEKLKREYFYPRMCTCIARSTLIILVAILSVHSAPLEACLAPNEERKGAYVVYGSAISFCVRDLQPDSTYELKVSYPASQPARFKLSLAEGGPIRSAPPGRRAEIEHNIDGNTPQARRLLASIPRTDPTQIQSDLDAAEDVMGEGDAVMFRSRGRRLLDTEKLVFATGPSSHSDADITILHPDLPPGGLPSSHVYLRVEAAPGSPTVRPGGMPAGVAFNLKLDPVFLGVIPGTALGLIPAMVAVVIVVALVVAFLRCSALSPFYWQPDGRAQQQGVGGSQRGPGAADPHSGDTPKEK